jgi:glycosyltransferase involved in cell wall biosynthesis
MDGLEWVRRKWSWAARAFILVAGHIAMYAANRIIADAEHMAIVLKGRFRRVPNCTTIAYGADLPDTKREVARVERYGLREGNYYIVVCRAEPENHLVEIIEGFIRSNSARTLAIVSNIDAGSSYGAKLLVAGNDPRIMLLGAIYDKAELAALRYYAFAYMHGHSVGGTNPSLLEAMANSNPVIAHDNPFNREVAADCALYFSAASDIPGLVEAMESDEAWRNKSGAAAKRRVAKYYSWDKITGQYLELLKQAC